MDKPFVKVQVTEVHEFYAWIPAEEAETALELFRQGEVPDVEIETVRREIVSESHLGRVDDYDRRMTQAMHAYLDSQRKEKNKLATKSAPQAKKVAEKKSQNERKALPGDTFDEQFNSQIDAIDSAIEQLENRNDRKSRGWKTLFTRTREKAASLHAQLAELYCDATIGRILTPRGNLLNPAGLVAFRDKLRTRGARLKALQARED
jgi:hypothetical protein